MLFSKYFLRKVAFGDEETDRGALIEHIQNRRWENVREGRPALSSETPPKFELYKTRAEILREKYPVGKPTEGSADDSLSSEHVNGLPVTVINMGDTKDYPEMDYMIRSMGGDPNDPKVRAAVEKIKRIRGDERRKQYNRFVPLGFRWSKSRSDDDINLPLILPHFNRFTPVGISAYHPYRSDTPSLINIFNGKSVGPHPLGGETAGFASENDRSMITGVPRKSGESSEDWINRALKDRVTTHELGHLWTFPQYVNGWFKSTDEADWREWVTPRLESIGMKYSPHPTADVSKGGYMFYTPQELSRAMAVWKAGMAVSGKDIPENLRDIYRSDQSAVTLMNDGVNKILATPEVVAAKKELDGSWRAYHENQKALREAYESKDRAKIKAAEADALRIHDRLFKAQDDFWEQVYGKHNYFRGKYYYSQLRGLPRATNDGDAVLARLEYIFNKAREYEEGRENGTIPRNEAFEELLELLNSAYRGAFNNRTKQLRPQSVKWAEPYAQPRVVG